MANVIHRTTLEFRRSVNEPDHPEPEWKWNPDMSAVVGVELRYWKAPRNWNAAGAGPEEMTQAEKDVVDADRAAAALADARAGAKADIDGDILWKSTIVDLAANTGRTEQQVRDALKAQVDVQTGTRTRTP